MRKLRTKAIIWILFFAFVVYITTNIATTFVLEPSFRNLEVKDTEKSVNQAISTINYALKELQGRVKDYASWDDTYSFVQTGDQKYVDQNLGAALFEDLNINFVAIVNNSRSLIIYQSFDLNNQTMIPTSQETPPILVSDDKIWNFSSEEDSHSGIMLLDSKPMLVGSEPILTSLGNGPIMGGILFGRYLDDSETSALSQIMNLNFSLTPTSNFNSQDNKQLVNTLNSNQGQTITKENSPTQISGYTIIQDIHSNPLFVLQVTQNRDAYQQGQSSMFFMLIVNLAFTLMFGGGFLILLERDFIKPLTNLASSIETMSTNPNQSETSPKFKTYETELIANAVKESINQRLDALNEVSRMVGHDLRNPLTGIRGASYLLKKKYGGKMDEKGNELLKTIDDCVEYSDKIVKDLLEYSAKIKLDKINTTPERLIIDSLATLTVPANVQVINKASNEHSVFVDNGKIERVFSNLIKNAIDAMPSGGELSISAKKINGQVAFDFSDNGTGMKEEVLKNLWTPFFTTKAKGMGIGLSICKKIVEAHGGKIEVKSSPGKGTTFTVFLPSYES